MTSQSRTPQVPIGSGFTATSTAEDVINGIDLSKKVAIVTGGYSGLGLETVRVLAKAGAKVIVPARDVPRARKAVEGIPNVTVEEMDLMSFDSIHHFTTRFLKQNLPLHILVNSAGIMASPFELDSRGYESQFSTNHLGHFQLTRELWPALTRAQGARVVSVSSLGHRFSPVDFEDLNFTRRPYERWAAYGQSKTANILFAVAVDEKGKEFGIRAFSLHPGGIVATGLGKHLDIEDLKKNGAVDQNGKPILDPANQMKTVEQGAATSVWCATSPKLDGLGGVYCENSEIAEPVTPEAGAANADFNAKRVFGVRPFAIDLQAAYRLWDLSEQMVFGVRK